MKGEGAEGAEGEVGRLCLLGFWRGGGISHSLDAEAGVSGVESSSVGTGGGDFGYGKMGCVWMGNFDD